MQDGYAIKIEATVVDLDEGSGMPPRQLSFSTNVPSSLHNEDEWDNFLADVLLNIGRAVGFGAGQWEDFLKRIDRRAF